MQVTSVKTNIFVNNDGKLLQNKPNSIVMLYCSYLL